MTIRDRLRLAWRALLLLLGQQVGFLGVDKELHEQRVHGVLPGDRSLLIRRGSR